MSESPDNTMPEPADVAETSPPPYDDTPQPGKEICPPTTLVVAAQTIHAQTTESPPLYQLSLGISHLSDVTFEVELSRVEPNRNGSGRQRHIYDLRHMRFGPGGLMSLPSDSPRYFIERASRRRTPGLQDLGFKKTRSLLPGSASFAAVPVDVSGKTSKCNIPNFVKGGAAVFTVNKHAWSDAQGNTIAIMHDDTDGGHTLTITTPLPRAEFDMLVALWCCKVWEYGVEHAEKEHEGIDGVRRKMKLAREFGIRGGVY